MRLTKKSDYALRFLTYLAVKGAVAVPTREVAGAEVLSLKFLQSVVGQLGQAGLVESSAGAKGGHKLARDPRMITVLDAVEAVEGPMSLMDCMEESGQCMNFSHCRIHSLLGRAQFAMNEVLSSATIADLVDCPVRPAGS